MLRAAILGCILVSLVHALPQYRDRILNGHNVPNPCCPGRTWDRVGHASPSGTQLNRFGSVSSISFGLPFLYTPLVKKKPVT